MDDQLVGALLFDGDLPTKKQIEEEARPPAVDQARIPGVLPDELLGKSPIEAEEYLFGLGWLKRGDTRGRRRQLYEFVGN